MASQTLIIQLARFGDLLQTSRLVKSLQAHSQVHLALDSSLSGLARIIYPGVIIHALNAHSDGMLKPEQILASNAEAVREIAANDYDLVANLNFSGLNFALSRLFDPLTVKGYASDDGQETRHRWTRLFFRLAAHRKLSPMNLIDFWGYFAPEPVAPEHVNPPASGRGQGIGIVLSGRNVRRSIPLSTLTRLALALRSKSDSGKMVLLGTRAEQPLARQFKDMAGPGTANDILDLTGKTGLNDLPEALSSLDTLLTPDTGTMHLAAHFGTRVTAVFLSSAFCFETGPYGQGHTVFQAMPPCAPCTESRKCGFDLVCHDILKSRESFRAIWKGGDSGLQEAAILESYLDDLGVTYIPRQGTDQLAGKRKAVRELVRRYLGLKPLDVPIPEEVVRGFYHEQQWILE